MKKIVCYLTFTLMIFNSCVAPQNPRKARESNSSDEVSGSRTPGSSNGDDAVPTGGGIDDTLIQAAGKVEITQIIDPNTGTFRKKVSIPRDFEGYLYLSGLNVAALKEKIISVKFKFGRDKTPIIIPAVIGRVPGGLSPLSSIDVIILDVQNKSFRNMRLLYDLFDYNDYQENTGNVADQLDPTDDPTNSGLYCRGLKVEDDPTFVDNPAVNTGDQYACDEQGDVCYYAYAKVQDSLLFKKEKDDAGNDVMTTSRPTKEQIDVLAKGYASDTLTEA